MCHLEQHSATRPTFPMQRRKPMILACKIFWPRSEEWHSGTCPRILWRHTLSSFIDTANWRSKPGFLADNLNASTAVPAQMTRNIRRTWSQSSTALWVNVWGKPGWTKTFLIQATRRAQKPEDRRAGQHLGIPFSKKLLWMDPNWTFKNVRLVSTCL